MEEPHFLLSFTGSCNRLLYELIKHNGSSSTGRSLVVINGNDLTVAKQLQNVGKGRSVDGLSIVEGILLNVGETEWFRKLMNTL
jgi:hypothetical protein